MHEKRAVEMWVDSAVELVDTLFPLLGIPQCSGTSAEVWAGSLAGHPGD